MRNPLALKLFFPVGNISPTIYQGHGIEKVLGSNLKNDRMISVRFQGKPFTVIQVMARSVMLKKLKLNGSMKTYKTFYN